MRSGNRYYMTYPVRAYTCVCLTSTLALTLTLCIGKVFYPL